MGHVKARNRVATLLAERASRTLDRGNDAQIDRAYAAWHRAARLYQRAWRMAGYPALADEQ